MLAFVIPASHREDLFQTNMFSKKQYGIIFLNRKFLKADFLWPFFGGGRNTKSTSSSNYKAD
jgi:hypothetical protein